MSVRDFMVVHPIVVIQYIYLYISQDQSGGQIA